MSAAVALATVAACSSSGGSKSKTSGTAGNSSSASTPAKNTKTGGTVYYLTKRPTEHWDPTRIYVGRDIADSSRLFYRTLVQYGTGAGADSNKLYPDLATDLGTASNGNKTWKFTLKSGIKWQDGSPITCADVAYGISRSFATDILTGGPNYSIQFLNIPAETKDTKNWTSAYHGPFNKVGQALYDKAVSCTGNTITFNLKKPVGDFNFATTLPAFAPYKQSQDQGAKSNYSIFSDGPYMLQGTWVKDKGATFVRNPNYDPKTDSPGIRNALPNQFVFVEGLATETIFDRLLANSGNDQFAVTDRAAPPAYLARVAAQKDRYTDVNSPFIDYVVPNFTKMTNPLVRQALYLSTDRAGYIAAEGGPSVASVANGLVLPALGAAGGYKQFKAYDAPDSGDPTKAAALLKQAGVKLPYPIHFTYSGGTPTSDKQASALAAGWEKAGFKVTLEGLTDTYYDIVQNPANAAKYDVTWGGWGADWPNASTVIPPLFDSRVNLSSTTNGQDYGLYKSDAVNAAIDKAYNTTDAAQRNAMWGDIDEMLAKDVAYVPLDNTKFPRLHGSKVTNYVESASTNGYPDLGQVGASS
ncbi:MAG TPA: ABC transporter substrate-binding protein [Jatrophihabitans sp.]|uniref:ABC transporter substrate-binding protein n=1 Tax=Jatrophihabitans sp. TaxID=1932789 RepID=UPI002DFEF6D8|nr:ABC transporter substrate-binding protein [Jatrophihabitans sp.]